MWSINFGLVLVLISCCSEWRDSNFTNEILIGPNNLLLAMLQIFDWQHCQWHCLQKLFWLKLPNSVRNAKKFLEAMPLAMLSNQKYTTLPRQDDSGQYHDASFWFLMHVFKFPAWGNDFSYSEDPNNNSELLLIFGNFLQQNGLIMVWTINNFIFV